MPTLRPVLLFALALAACTPLTPAAEPPADAASAPAGPTWALTTRGSGPDKVIYRFLDTLGTQQAQRAAQADRVTLTWRYESANGMPPEDEKAGMDELEDLLEPLVERDGFSNLALVTTGAGVREWTYYTRSGRAFRERLQPVLAAHPRLAGRIQVDALPDPGWTAWEEFRERLSQD